MNKLLLKALLFLFFIYNVFVVSVCTFSYPPFSQLITFLIESKSERFCEGFASNKKKFQQGGYMENQHGGKKNIVTKVSAHPFQNTVLLSNNQIGRWWKKDDNTIINTISITGNKQYSYGLMGVSICQYKNNFCVGCWEDLQFFDECKRTNMNQAFNYAI